ncbi:hypothetical protein C8R46DRAFT_1115745, partial [Mycena filopes]
FRSQLGRAITSALSLSFRFGDNVTTMDGPGAPGAYKRQSIHCRLFTHSPISICQFAAQRHPRSRTHPHSITPIHLESSHPWTPLTPSPPLCCLLTGPTPR